MNQDYQNHKNLCENHLYILNIIDNNFYDIKICFMQAFREWPGYDFFCGSNLDFAMENCKAKQNHILASRTKESTGTSVLFQCKQMFVASFNEPINEL